MDKSLISIAIPVYPQMKNGDALLKRCLDSIKRQTYQNYEVVITTSGTMAENTNKALKASKGDLIKILYQDDYLANENSLKSIIEAFKGYWLVTGCEHDDNGVVGRPHLPFYDQNENHIGSPSVLTLRNGLDMYFDENLGWLLDLDLYKRLYAKYGEPDILDDINVVIGLHEGQATNTMGDEIKTKERTYLNEKYS
jgi:hypothetical protein